MAKMDFNGRPPIIGVGRDFERIRRITGYLTGTVAGWNIAKRGGSGMNFDRNKVERVKARYPAGTRIELTSLCNDETGMPPGPCGTVIGCDDQTALLTKWDNGRSLSPFPGEDSFQVIGQKQTEEPGPTMQL